MKKVFALLMALCLVLVSMAAMADTITVALNPEYPPFESKDDNLQEHNGCFGYDIDMIAAVAEKAGFDLEFVPMEFASVVTEVKMNPNTIGVSGISITDERKMEVDFSEGYINAGLIVVAKVGSGYTTVDDLKGKTIGVQLGTTSDLAAEEITGIDHTAQYTTFINAIMDLQGNKIDAVIVDKPVGQAILASLQDETLEILDLGLQADWYGIAINKDNPELKEKIDAALAELEAEGFFEQLAMKYFTEGSAE